MGEAEFPLAVTMLTGAWMAAGHRVDVMLNGDGTYDRLWADIGSMTSTIGRWH